MTAAPWLGRTVAGWRLLQLIGQGAHGSVYLAEGAGRAEPVAVKLVTLEGGAAAQRAFLHAADLCRRLQHPGIVAVHAAGIEGATGWLAMEAVPGSDLTRYTHGHGLLPEPLVVRLALRVAQALVHAHGQGVVHRDLKPANVLVDWPSDTVKIGDFGLARAADSAQTGTGIVLGSPAYMAPEQLAGKVPTSASDLYALGAMLYQLLCGRLPLEAPSMGELLRRVAAEAPPDLRTLVPGLTPALGALVARLLAKRPSDRPTDAAQLAAELQALSGS